MSRDFKVNDPEPINPDLIDPELPPTNSRLTEPWRDIFIEFFKNTHMQPSNDRREPSLPANERNANENANEKAESDQQKSDPPLTEIKGVTDPEEYVEPEVEDEPEK